LPTRPAGSIRRQARRAPDGSARRGTRHSERRGMHWIAPTAHSSSLLDSRPAFPPRWPMRRIGLAGALAISLLAPLVAEPQQTTQNRRVGVVALADAQSGAHILQALQDGLRQHGWVEGRNVKLEIRLAEGRLDRLTSLVDELARLSVDVIVTGSNVETAATRQRAPTIPIVMLIGAGPVGSGFTSSLAHPSGNITGLAFDPTPEIFGKHLELIRELSPRAVSVIVIRNPQLPGGVAYWNAATRAGQKLGLTLRSATVQSADDVQPAL